MKPVFLLTDFGTDDTYVGQMKAVVLRRAPGCVLVDLTHAIEPQDVAGGARALAGALPYLPRPSVILAVVDPGVGTERRAIVAEADGRVAVGPDNGLLTPMLAADGAVVTAIDPAAVGAGELSATFHGRDLFAPAAAALALADGPAAVAPHITDAVQLEGSVPRRSPSGWEAHIVDVDRFGNLITDLRGDQLTGRVQVSLPDATRLELVETYGKVAEGELLALVGSGGFVEIACRGGSAARVTGLARGDMVRAG